MKFIYSDSISCIILQYVRPFCKPFLRIPGAAREEKEFFPEKSKIFLAIASPFC